ncbi:MAG: hypothetical protein AAGK97_09750 [Bacteroidota bacterium]
MIIKISSLLFLLIFLSNILIGQTTTWTGNGADSAWFNNSNWTNGIPNNNDIAIIPIGHYVEARGNITIKGLKLNGSVLQTIASLSIQDTFLIDSTSIVEWNGGPWLDATIINYGTIKHERTNSSPLLYFTATLDNYGTFNKINGGMSIQGTFTNHAVGTFNINGDNNFINGVTRPSSIFINYGLVRKNEGLLENKIAVPFINYGSIEVDQGSLNFDNTNTLFTSGFYNSSDTAMIRLESVKISNRLEGHGKLQIEQVSLNANCTLAILGQGVFWTNFNINGTDTLINEGIMEANYPFPLSLNVPLFINEGHFNLSSVGVNSGLKIDQLFRNTPSGIFELKGATRLFGSGSFLNEGAFLKTGVDNCKVDMDVDWKGVLEVVEGVLGVY